MIPRRILGTMVSIAAIFLLLNACSSINKMYEVGKGDRSLQQDNYDEAVAWYQKALIKKPDNESLLIRLRDAAKKAAYDHLCEASKLLLKGKTIEVLESALRGGPSWLDSLATVLR